ncbi:O-methyltransferase [Nitratireductor aquibiodomus]|uniref:O-methyltransferase n=1 Tax=Nitratireductor aquibiodomus TaxID=204799 RepID=UPI00046812C2|nr:class I SAM-dependent methyltransferase [Nitratireductor aquibiodomus]
MPDTDERLRTVLDRYERRRTQERSGRGRESTETSTRMFAIGPEAGTLLNVLARSIKSPRILEIGTSYGYSGLWLAEAARARGGHVLSLECDAHKSDHARGEAHAAGLAEWIEHRTGDAVTLIPTLEGKFDMVFLDLWKDLYVPCFDAFVPKLAPGALVVADNMGRGGGAGTRAYAERIRCEPRFESVMVPVGTGMEISRFARTL